LKKYELKGKGKEACSVFFLNEWPSKLENTMKKDIYYNNFYMAIFFEA